MIIIGVIEQVVSDSAAKVRVAEYDGVAGVSNSTPTDQLVDAKICAGFGEYPNLQVGDMVFVAYERRKVEKPVVIGRICGTATKEGGYPNYFAQDLTVYSQATLPTSTTIGNVTATELKYIHGLKNPIQDQIDDIIVRLKNLETSPAIVPTEDPAVTLEGFTGMYDGEYHSVKVVSYNGTLSYSTDNKTYQDTNPSFKNVGTYTVYVKAVLDSKSIISIGKVTITSSPEWGSISNTIATYDGNPHSITVTANS